MADPTPKPTTSPDDMHWVLYLREDIQEIRQDLRALVVRVDAVERRLNERIDSRFGLLLMAMIALFGMTIGFMEYRLPPL
ncbi:MAG: hypothetical protein HN712_20305 [Gemmatimonadetes bacterium]|nr:hypothetical protein [Gemmatimonadota bacterium]MBT6145980.1 hypothetical protein [Gemmatimonadota bacterium]MBT7862669.1 hypothetical protein [Gemmatimonadota bacterium]